VNTDCDELLDKYSIVKETLPYLDAPVQGHMKNVETGEMFAFRCIEIIRGSLWHWVLVPVESTSESPEAAMAKLKARRIENWVSIVEDKRGDLSRSVVVAVPSSHQPHDI